MYVGIGHDMQATVVRAYAAFGSIRNGGFQDFYESPTWDAAQIAEDFRTAGLKDLAAALRGSLGIFPGGRQLRGRERDAHLARVGQASWRGGEELFYRTKEADFWRAAMVFMRLHRDDFPT